LVNIDDYQANRRLSFDNYQANRRLSFDDYQANRRLSFDDYQANRRLSFEKRILRRKTWCLVMIQWINERNANLILPWKLRSLWCLTWFMMVGLFVIG